MNNDYADCDVDMKNATALGEQTQFLQYCANSLSRLRLRVVRLYLHCRI